MSYILIKRSQLQKSRKDHQCCWCGESIPKGSQPVYRSYKFNGEFTSDYMHHECERAMLDSDLDSMINGWSIGDNERGKVYGGSNE